MVSVRSVMESGDVLRGLRCPYCRGDLSARWLTEQTGIVSCSCGEVPVIESILWMEGRQDQFLRLSPSRTAALRRLLDGDVAGALGEALFRSSRARARRALTTLERLGLRPPRLLRDQARAEIERSVLGPTEATFESCLRALRNKPYADYLYHRFANPSLLAAIPVILLLRLLPSDARVLEIGGGAGHASFLMHRFFPGLNLTFTDGDFTNLYLARRFMAPAATCICLDAEAALPFGDGSFDAVYCQDSFHYLREKAGLIDELRRIIRPGGLWLFPHLHNALADNPAPGFPLPAPDYARLFSFLNARLFPEASLLEQFHAGQNMDLSRPASSVEVQRAPALTLVGGPPTLWTRHEFADICLDPLPDLGVNRIYQNSLTGDSGPKRWPSPDLRHECREADQLLPHISNVDRPLMARLASGHLDEADAARLRSLIRDFVLIPLPPHYG